MMRVYIYLKNTSIFTYFIQTCFNSIVQHALITCFLGKYLIFQVLLGIYEIPHYMINEPKWIIK